ncbi:MAG: DNA translocase FtsK [Nitrospirae bacterium]|nr:DNA translocase FtsK [Nitrospirota bacterium]
MAERLKRIKEEILGVFFTLTGVYLAISLISYSRWDPSFFTFTNGPVKNYGGIVGSYLSDLLLTLIGAISYLLPLLFLIYGIKRILGKEKRRETLLGIFILFLITPVLISLVCETFNIKTGIDPGGLWGSEIAKALKVLFSIPGAYIFSLSFFFTSLIILSPVTASEALEQFIQKTKSLKKIPVQKESPIRVVESPPPTEEQQAHEEITPSYDRKSQYEASKPVDSSSYRLPSLSLLKSYDQAQRPSKEELLERAALLEEKLADFNITGKVTQVHPGPVVTMYEFEPTPGIKISKIVSLAEDLGRALGGLSVRISPIPGKTPLGIEVPNRNRGIVGLKEIISSDIFTKSRSKLTLALGKDIYGRPIVGDLTLMPHLLVAGTTGSGKSVLINSMVMSLLYKVRPDEVKMLMIDPKLLELSRYDGIPHLIAPVITNPRDATVALKKMVIEMENRYRLIAEQGARNIDNFNRVVPEDERLPYIVIIIDELADLMFTASKEVEDSIVRLAQMARASGIHLILATQRPSVDVITGIIKANFPTRIAFQVSSKVDSRTILDQQGAEQLIGKGDMLLMRPGARLTRLHGAYVSEEEIRRVTEFIKQQGAPDYSIFESIELERKDSPTGETEERDELYNKVIEYAEGVGEISISSIQRRFKIGYNRAARIMQMLEEDGLVGPPKGAGKPRDFIGRH